MLGQLALITAQGIFFLEKLLVSKQSQEVLSEKKTPKNRNKRSKLLDRDLQMFLIFLVKLN